VSKGPIKNDNDIAKIPGMRIDTMIVFELRDGFDARGAHLATMAINHCATKCGYLMRIQKYLHKLYAIRVT
jgi:hypothetical protein